MYILEYPDNFFYISLRWTTQLLVHCSLIQEDELLWLWDHSRLGSEKKLDGVKTIDGQETHKIIQIKHWIEKEMYYSRVKL